MGIFDWLFGGKKTINKEIAKLEKRKQQSKLRLKTYLLIKIVRF